ncbi:MAG: hypothetical protein OEV25_09935 [Deltaproteobacteria bacterium]|nr:hypothetical protein [Deltaproteobacteria bacterium]MDH3895888.1 hypothetical protein [Deltaproteobacteria bacterium]MDH3963723.1 hypothetical protein [Deltaproteobacteria bacterium]
MSRDREDGRATGQPQGLESEAYLHSTSQGSRPEDARKEGHIHGRSSRFVNNPGQGPHSNGLRCKRSSLWEKINASFLE